MHIKITGSPPRTRCYKCGTTNVEGVCHHCHRPMCSLHIRQPVDFQGRLLSMEFTQLGLRETSGEIPVHCEFCHHLDIPIHWVLLLSGIGIFFLAFILPFDDLERFIGFLIASTTTALGFYIYIMRKSKLVQSRPFLPLLPRLNPIKIREIIRGRISLDSKGDYQVYIPYAEGIITVASNLGKAERDQLEQYQRKYHLADSRDVQFIAGFLSLKSSMGVTYLDNLFTGDNTIWRLRGTHPFSTNFERYQSGEWHKSRRYNLIKIASSRSFPIRIIPTLIQGAAQRSLDLEIQWIEGIKGTNNFAIHKIDSLQIQVPAIWGQIQDANGGMVASINDQKVDNVVNTITWNGVPIPDSERTRGHHTFSISFEDPIDVSNSIYGSLVVTFTGTFSDVEEINLFYPQGGQRQVDSVDISTQLIVDFELSLAGLRYQDIRVVPDLVKDKDKLEPLVVKGITPDYETVIALTNAISEKFYIKRIIENPPRTGERANLVNRYWDIAGRSYEGVYPIDFHLMLSGEIMKEDEVNTHTGLTKVRLTVQGSYANTEMEEIIENLYFQLSHLTRNTLERLSNEKSSPNQDIDNYSSTALSPQNLSLSSNTGGRVDRINALRKRLDDLFELLIIGRLTEETFLNLKSEVEKEIQSIQTKQQFN